jgi:polysaccharide biosynthesis/export protein
MKRCSLLLLIFLAAGTIHSQENSDGFGLQASIFRTVRSVNTDLNRNFAGVSNYNLTPGDVFTLTLSSGIGLNGSTGSQITTYSIQLQEDYTLNIPIIGSISARGKKIPELRSFISKELITALTLQHVNFTLTAPAQYNVFIFGNVEKPGFITSTPMHRLIDAIALAGGIKPNGTYRAIQLQRGEKVLTIDISRFYSYADFDANPFLRPGDQIFIPDAGIVASITGLIQFPGLYELIEDESLATLISLSGGLTPGALGSEIEIQGLDNDGGISRLVVSEDEADSIKLAKGDRILIRSVSENVERVTIEGAIYGSRLIGENPVQVPAQTFRLDAPYFPGLTLLDLLESVGGPTPRAEKGKSFIRRSSTGEVRPVDLEAVWTKRDLLANPDLLPGDYVFVPLQPSEVFISGAVVRPGAVPYTPGYLVSDYLLLSGGINPNTAKTDALFLVDETGGQTPLGITDTVEAGSHVYVERKWLFSTDQNVQNTLIAAAWVTSTITIVGAVIDFIISYIVPLFQ